MIGSTGRSTSLHLHYEIRIDDLTFDPARFLDAGRLVGIFANPGHTGRRSMAETVAHEAAWKGWAARPSLVIGAGHRRRARRSPAGQPRERN